MTMLYPHFYCDCEPNTLKTLYTSFVSMLFLFGIPILRRTLQPLNLSKDLLLKCVQVCIKAWEDVDYDEWLCMLNLSTLKAKRYSLKFSIFCKVSQLHPSSSICLYHRLF